MKRKSFLFVCNAFLALSFISPAFATNPIEESGNRFYLVAGGQAEMAISSLNNSNNIGNLKYVPQLELDYLTGSIEKNRLGLAGVTVVPLAFEYRGNNSSLGIIAGIGEFGVYFPVSGFADKSGPVYVFGFNNVSLGLVYYF